jgi:hypothetical protein
MAEAGVQGLVPFQNGCCSFAIIDHGDWWEHKDVVITVVIIEYHEVVVSSARQCDESVGLVGVDLTGWFNHGSIAQVCAFVDARWGYRFRLISGISS